jgi:hypothetical protein
MTQDEIIEMWNSVIKYAPSEVRITEFAKLVAAKAILELESQEPVQVSPLEFVEMVMEKEHLIGKPIFWAEWPSREKNT